MRRFAVLFVLLVGASAQAEFLRVEVTFQDTGCASCIASLEGRLSRVRGVERVEIDAERGVAVMHLAPENRVRLTPLLSRITQDGTAILATTVEGLGVVASEGDGLRFTPSDLNEAYRLELEGEAAKVTPEADVVYRVRGSVSGVEPGAAAVLKASSVEKEAKLEAGRASAP